MRLERAQIRNFRSIEYIEFPFQPRCRVLVGINESGKSNILNALSLLDPDVEVEPGDLRELRTNEKPYEEAYVRFVFALDANDKLKVLKALRPKILGKLENPPIIKIGAKRLSIAQFVNWQPLTFYQIDLRTGERHKRFCALPPNCQIVGPWKSIDGSSSDEPVVADSRHSDFDPTNADELDPRKLNALVGTEFHNILDDEMPNVLFWEYDEDELLPAKIDMASFASGPDSCLPLMHMFELASIDDIAEAIALAKQTPTGLRNLLNRVARRATRHLHSVWQEYKDLEIQLSENGPNIDAHIVDRHNVYDLARRSDGYKRFVSFLLDVSAKAHTHQLQNTLYLHDEADVGLHPSGARHLRDELVKVAKENYVVYATHSIFMIDGDYLDRHLIVSKTNETTTIEQASDSNFTDEEVLFNALGYSIFQHLRPSNIVFEGWRDKRLFEVAVSGAASVSGTVKRRFQNVGRCHARGVKDIAKVASMLELATRDCLILTDSDQPAREHQKNYKGYGTWLRYDQLDPVTKPVTGEDFIRDDVIIPALQTLAAQDNRLQNVPTTHAIAGVGKLQKIARWFNQSGLDPNETKLALDRLKEIVFSNLKPSQITDSYFKLLIKLCDSVESRRRHRR